jgi:acyl-CoA synthetase (NDP forming)
MKAISKQAVHKTESGAVRLNIANLEEANRVWEEFWTTIPAVEGVLIQKMEKKGREVIIGMKKDNTFGSAIIFGLGGIFTEAIKDTTIRVAPFGKEEALKMMKDIKGIKILQDFRGEPPVNFEMLSQIIVNLSRLALEHPEIKEIDLNPVMATENSATIIDARVMI